MLNYFYLTAEKTMIKQVVVLCLGNSFELLNTDNITAINVHGVDQFISSIHFSHSLNNVLCRKFILNHFALPWCSSPLAPWPSELSQSFHPPG